jgi:hypothetical protein
MTTTATTNGTSREQAMFPRPAWAEETHYPEDGSHDGHITVGPVTLSLGQDIRPNGELEPICVWLPEYERLVGAQACRDLAVALMEAVRIIEAATS